MFNNENVTTKPKTNIYKTAKVQCLSEGYKIYTVLFGYQIDTLFLIELEK